jgi:hypothetical protein
VARVSSRAHACRSRHAAAASAKATSTAAGTQYIIRPSWAGSPTHSVTAYSTPVPAQAHAERHRRDPSG